MAKPINPDTQAKAQTVDPTVDHSRRRLLGMAVYVPPIVIGVISLQQAGCQPGPSCMPQSCNPNGGPCNPNPIQPNPGTGTESIPSDPVVDPAT